jgi:hypothetical protein
MPNSSSKVVSESDYLRVELTAINAARKGRLGADAETAPLAGIGLSGGGIRSASLSLGVMQALAESDLLKRFDFLSTVSGGGYTGGSLQWWWYRGAREDGTRDTQTKFGLGPQDFPYGPAHAEGKIGQDTLGRAHANLTYLRSHSSYLTPGNGLTMWSLLAVLLRTVFISLFIWIPLLAAVFALLHAVDLAYLEPIAQDHAVPNPFWNGVALRWTDNCTPATACEVQYRALYALALYLFYALTALFGVAGLIFACVSRAPQNGSAVWTVPPLVALMGGAAWSLQYLWMRFDAFDPGMVALVVFLGIVLLTALVVVAAEIFTPPSMNASYWLRRFFEWVLGAVFIPTLALPVLATVPLIPLLATSAADANKLTAAGVVGLLSGIGSALYGYYTFLKNIVPSLVGQIAATVGAILYLYATLVIAYFLSLLWLGLPVGGDFPYLVPALQAAFCLAAFLSIFANINYVGLHRFYRDRLMEAFMPTDKAVSEQLSKSSPVADNLLVSELAKNITGTGLPPIPYLLINTNVILVDDKTHKFAVRGGDNFVISPLFVGSSATEWQDTDAYIRAKGPLTLASSVAASGAAVTASAGYIGTGITMNPLVKAVMSLLNIRLGLWVPNPRRGRIWPFNSIPTFLHPGLQLGIFFNRHSSKSRFLELTDGGHFENLGLYELIRRKLPIILVVDGEADPTISLSSLVSAAHRIEEDFQATLTFLDGKGPERLIMRKADGYPVDLRRAKAPYLLAQINYSNDTHGVLIYIKSTLIERLDFTTAGYLAANPAFPHQSTADQFFDPQQFDAYRYLGYQSAQRMIAELDLTNTMVSSDNVAEQYKTLRDNQGDDCT